MSKNTVREIMQKKRKRMADGGNVADTGSSPYDTLGSKPSYIPGTVGLAAPIAALNSQQDKPDPNDTQGIQPTSSPVDWLAGEAGARLGGSLAEAAPSILGNEAGAIGSKPNMINIEHYSKEPNLSVMDPDKMGSGIDAYTPGRRTEPPFSFSYREGMQPEGLVKDRSPYKYTGQVDASKLYDLSTDPEGIASKAIQANGGAKDMSQIAQATKDAGYSGFYTSRSPNPESQNAIMTFDKTPVMSSSHFIFTPEQPMYPEAASIAPTSRDSLVKALNDRGYKAEPVTGHYNGAKEDSILVNHVSPEDAEQLHDLSRQYGQESSLYSNDGQNEFRYSNGPNTGQSVYGQGKQFSQTVPEGGSTELNNGTVVQHNLDFSNMQPTEGEAARQARAQNQGFDPSKIRSKFAHFDPKKKGQAGLSYAGGGGVAVGASIDPIQGGNLNAYADGGNVADTAQQAPAPNTTNVMSPTGDLVSIPNEQLPAALHPVNGYRLATPDDVAAYKQTQKYGTPGQVAQTFGESALSTSTMGLVPGIGSAEDIRARQQENPIASIAGGVLPFVAEQFIPGAGEAQDVGLLGKAAQVATTVPRMIDDAGSAIKAASGLTGIGGKALQYAAESAIMQGQEEVSKMLLKDPNQSVTSAIADEGLASLFGGALGAATGGIGRVADLWESKFGAKAGDEVMNKTLPDIPTLELQSGVNIPASLHGALGGDPDAYNTVQTLMKSTPLVDAAFNRTFIKFTQILKMKR
jgi:hypothetical protein